MHPSLDRILDATHENDGPGNPPVRRFRNRSNRPAPDQKSRCPIGTAVKGHNRSLLGVGLKCKRWNCADCAEVNRRRVIRRAIVGHPTAMMTLTSNPAAHNNVEEAAEALKEALYVLVRRLRRRFGKDRVSYMAVFERTKRGWPHLHVLLRAPFVPQRFISRFMARRTGAPIVDIRAVRSRRDVARYVGKYIAKEPTRFAGRQRYWTSRDWRLEQDDTPEADDPDAHWQITATHPRYLAHLLAHQHGYSVELAEDGLSFLARPPNLEAAP